MNNSNEDLIKSLLIVITVLIIVLFIIVYLFPDTSFRVIEVSPKVEERLFKEVDVYSYQLEKSQTDKDSLVGAFGDTLEMDVGIIALSRDLKLFFEKNDTVLLTIQDKTYTFVFKDIMGPRHRNSVDLLMKENIREKGKLWLKTQTQGR